MKRKSVWVVERNEYESELEGIFSMREDALIAATALGYDKDAVSEYVLDPCLKQLRSHMHKYQVIITASGKIESCELCYSDDLEEDKCFLWERKKSPMYKDVRGIENALNCSVWAKGEKSAVKAATRLHKEYYSEI